MEGVRAIIVVLAQGLGDHLVDASVVDHALLEAGDVWIDARDSVEHEGASLVEAVEETSDVEGQDAHTVLSWGRRTGS